MILSADKKDRSRGSILLESIIAINIIVVGLLGVLNLLSNSLALNRDVGQKFVATYLAVEGIEVVKNLIDTNYANGRPWNDGLSDGTSTVSYDSNSLGPDSGNLQLNDNGIYNYIGGKPTFFKREIGIKNLPVDGQTYEIKVVSKVKWLTKKGPVEVDLEDHFFNWR